MTVLLAAGGKSSRPDIKGADATGCLHAQDP